jgi:nucleoid DNA-binding protein
MKRRQLVKEMAGELNKTQKEVYDFLRVLESSMLKFFKEDEVVRLNHIGTFKPVNRKERNYRDPTTKRLSIVPKRKSISFRPSKVLKRELNK